MINTYTYRKLIWIDLESPTRDEVKKVMEEYHLDPLVAQELLSPNLKPRIERLSNFLYLVLNFPIAKQGGKTKASKKISLTAKNRLQEIDFLIGKDIIITASYDAIDPLHHFAKMFEVNSVLDKSELGEHAGYIFFYMMEKIYQSLRNELEGIDDQLICIEEDIFAEREKEMVFELSTVSRSLLDFKKALSHHHGILNIYSTLSENFFGPGYESHARRLIDEYGKIEAIIHSQFELLDELRSTNDSLLTTKQNEVMKFFTVITSIIFLVELIISVLTISLPNNPFFLVAGNYAITLIVIAACSFGMLGFFKYKKWL
ncbi:MAG: CorA family divalent cation transporter [bacterium]